MGHLHRGTASGQIAAVQLPPRWDLSGESRLQRYCGNLHGKRIAMGTNTHGPRKSAPCPGRVKAGFFCFVFISLLFKAKQH